MRSVAECLGNTPAGCRKSSVDPRVLDRYAEGALSSLQLDVPAGRGLEQLAAQPEVERAVIALLDDRS